jgi:hypothetical protein
MLAHTFTGTTMRSLVGLETEQAVFHRFRERRRAERDYVPAPSASSAAARHQAA